MSDGPACLSYRGQSTGPTRRDRESACARTLWPALLRLALAALSARRARRVLALSVAAQRAHGLCKVVLAKVALLVNNEVDAVGAGREQVVLERGRAVVGVDDVARLLVDRADPLGKLHGVGDGRRQEDVADLVRQEDDRLLPHDAALCETGGTRRGRSGSCIFRDRSRAREGARTNPCRACSESRQTRPRRPRA